MVALATSAARLAARSWNVHASARVTETPVDMWRLPSTTGNFISAVFASNPNYMRRSEGGSNGLNPPPDLLRR